MTRSPAGEIRQKSMQYMVLPTLLRRGSVTVLTTTEAIALYLTSLVFLVFHLYCPLPYKSGVMGVVQLFIDSSRERCQTEMCVEKTIGLEVDGMACL